jgi:hypothetical protein
MRILPALGGKITKRQRSKKNKKKNFFLIKNLKIVTSDLRF